MLYPIPPWLKILARRPVNIRFASTRARDLAARHWELVRLHSPHPTERHVLDHEATKAAVVDHTGLKATTDVITPSTPKEAYLRGVRIPRKPKPPESDECCMSGCAVCVYDLYLSSLNDYKQEAKIARTNLREKWVPVHEWPDDLQVQERKEASTTKTAEEEGLNELDMDPSMKAFLMLEKKIGKKK